jgi:hypothetical protein
MRQRLLLHSIYSRVTNDEILKEKSKRTCFLSFSDNLKEMIIKYEKGGTLKHFEEVEDIKETHNGVVVTTEKKIWKFIGIN